jgi:hypothetical protein
MGGDGRGSLAAGRVCMYAADAGDLPRLQCSSRRQVGRRQVGSRHLSRLATAECMYGGPALLWRGRWAAFGCIWVHLGTFGCIFGAVLVQNRAYSIGFPNSACVRVWRTFFVASVHVQVRQGRSCSCIEPLHICRSAGTTLDMSSTTCLRSTSYFFIKSS